MEQSGRSPNNGQEKTVSEYHKIETLYERDEKTFKIKPELILKNRVYGLIKSWVWTEKIDGTNIRVVWNPTQHNDAGTERGNLSFGGKTNNAQLPADLVKWLYANISVQNLREVFPDSPVVLYGEGYGAGIQKGGGLYSSIKKLILFDVFVEDRQNPLGGWWLSDENMRDVAQKLTLDAVPLAGEMNLFTATSIIKDGFDSVIGPNPHPAEGLVGRPIEALFDKKGHRLIVKLKTKDF
jgi:RNA ligase-like protein